MINDVIKSNAIAIVGMCKNAGKTTVLNALIRNMCDEKLALTSIGRDGERIDVATTTPKPDVYVHSGTLFATASEMLKYCDTTLEILDTCGIYTPLGEVIIAQAHSDGNIQIAGPSTVTGLCTVHDMLKKYGAKKTIFDGAISRKSLSVPSLCDETILCSGASYSPSMRTTVEDTAYFAKLFTLDLSNAIYDLSDKFALFYADEIKNLSSVSDVKEALIHNKRVNSVYISGAVTDTIIVPFIELGVRDVQIVANDPSKLLLSKKNFDKCEARNINIKVAERSELRAITVNPFSAYGIAYDKDAFYDEMCSALESFNIPVFDVKKERL